jgi:hypothetical protein
MSKIVIVILIYHRHKPIDHLFTLLLNYGATTVAPTSEHESGLGMKIMVMIMLMALFRAISCESGAWYSQHELQPIKAMSMEVKASSQLEAVIK